jgi:hypothetical protein
VVVAQAPAWRTTIPYQPNQILVVHAILQGYHILLPSPPLPLPAAATSGTLPSRTTTRTRPTCTPTLTQASSESGRQSDRQQLSQAQRPTQQVHLKEPAVGWLGQPDAQAASCGHTNADIIYNTRCTNPTQLRMSSSVPCTWIPVHVLLPHVLCCLMPLQSHDRAPLTPAATSTTPVLVRSPTTLQLLTGRTQMGMAATQQAHWQGRPTTLTLWGTRTMPLVRA